MYKRLETEDAHEQLRRGARVPSTSRQTVLSRAAEAWQRMEHDAVSRGFVHAGLANKLDGSEDHLLGFE
eukprot:2026589-Alexandrium_andersonii.AAC.1